MNLSEYATSILILSFAIFILASLISLEKRQKFVSKVKNKVVTGKTLQEIKEDIIIKQGSEQIKKLVSKHLNIPVSLL